MEGEMDKLRGDKRGRLLMDWDATERVLNSLSRRANQDGALTNWRSDTWHLRLVSSRYTRRRLLLLR